MRWIIGIVIVVVIAILGYQYFGARDMDVAEQTQEAAPEAADQGAEATGEAADQAAEATGEAADQAATQAEQGAEATQEAGEQAGEAADQAAGGAEQAADETAEATDEAAQQAGQAAQQAGEQAQQAGEQAQQATQEAADQAQTGAQQAGEAAQQAGEAAQQAGEGALTEAQTAALTVGDVNIGEELTGLLQNAQSSLEGITDAQSAEAAVPKLNDINAQLEELSTPVGQLPEDAKKVLADVLRDRVTELKTLADRVTGQQGVGDVVKPALEPIMAKLDSWMQQPA
jgi:hypothetical protein